MAGHYKHGKTKPRLWFIGNLSEIYRQWLRPEKRSREAVCKNPNLTEIWPFTIPVESNPGNTQGLIYKQEIKIVI